MFLCAARPPGGPRATEPAGSPNACFRPGKYPRVLPMSAPLSQRPLHVASSNAASRNSTQTYTLLGLLLCPLTSVPRPVVPQERADGVRPPPHPGRGAERDRRRVRRGRVARPAPAVGGRVAEAGRGLRRPRVA